jgi:pimeloyl-ACP methyl ester carboxylesterase
MMSRQVLKRWPILLALVILLQLGISGPVGAAAESQAQVKELNFVFLHGAAGTSCNMQLLADSVLEQIPPYIREYEQATGVKVTVDSLDRCYPDADVETWAKNIVESVDNHFGRKGNLVLVGHSMGGKASLYAAAKNVGDIAGRVAMVVTINTPVKALNSCQVSGGGSFTDYCRGGYLIRSDNGLCDSIGNYDSSDDGKWVSQNKHWLAFISGENAPFSSQFNYGGVDLYPRNMDDGAVPISAQYSDGADVVYYGEYGHSDMQTVDEAADFIAAGILQYVFGGNIEFSALAREGSFQHKAGLLVGRDYWQDILGDELGLSGRVVHWNESYTSWQEWEDVLEYYLPSYENDLRSRYEVSRVNSSAIFTSIEEVRWLYPDNPRDYRVYLRTRAAPRNSIDVDWSIYRQGVLPLAEGGKRDRYEIEVVACTPLADVYQASWATDNPRDLRVQALSRTERPFRRFEADWRVYVKEVRYRKVIDQIPALSPASGP